MFLEWLDAADGLTVSSICRVHAEELRRPPLRPAHDALGGNDRTGLAASGLDAALCLFRCDVTRVCSHSAVLRII